MSKHICWCSIRVVVLLAVTKSWSHKYIKRNFMRIMENAHYIIILFRSRYIHIRLYQWVLWYFHCTQASWHFATHLHDSGISEANWSCSHANTNSSPEFFDQICNSTKHWVRKLMCSLYTCMYIIVHAYIRSCCDSSIVICRESYR